jgi:hypothetical protein
MAKKNMLGLAKLDKKKIRSKGRHSKKSIIKATLKSLVVVKESQFDRI